MDKEPVLSDASEELKGFKKQLTNLVSNYHSVHTAIIESPVLSSQEAQQERYSREGGQEIKKTDREEYTLKMAALEDMEDSIKSLLVRVYRYYKERESQDLDTWDIEREFGIAIPKRLHTTRVYEYDPNWSPKKPQFRESGNGPYGELQIGSKGIFSTPNGDIEGEVVGRTTNGRTQVRTSLGMIEI